jgi:Glycosyltransferase Family 4
MNKYRKLVFLCGASDFHAMDWYRSAIALFPEIDINILTDIIAGEGYKKLVNDSDKVSKLFIIDKILFRNQSNLGNKWRNLIKLIVFPLQVILIYNFSRKNPNSIYHAHSMYYLFLAWGSGIPFVGTPQGSDILIKPFSSKIYRYFTIKSLKAAKAITVDSLRMKEKIYELAGIEAHVIQNGIDICAINEHIFQADKEPHKREMILSIRGFTPLYRIKEIVSTRNSSSNFAISALTFIYPFYEKEYWKETLTSLKPIDKDFGRVGRAEMYQLLLNTKLVISIPKSDSSPRSVYEAIFCGCAVAITHHSYYDVLPQCMKDRIVLIKMNDKNWLDKAIEKSLEITSFPYHPSDEALNTFDQHKSFRILEKILFNKN